jgi:prepilin peptidase CpaA
LRELWRNKRINEAQSLAFPRRIRAAAAKRPFLFQGNGVSAFLIMAVLPLLLALAAGWDLASYAIPNLVSIAIVAVFIGFAALIGMPLGILGAHLAAAAVALVAGFTLFALRWIGGGDAKLFAATALWFGFGDLMAYALVAAVIGGGLTLALLLVRRVPLPAVLIRQDWIARLHDHRSGVPYGVALAAGALAVLPNAQILRLAGLA